MIRRADSIKHEAAASELGQLARALDGSVNPATDAVSRAEFLHALHSVDAPRSSRRRWTFAAAGGGALLAAAAVALLVLPRAPEPLEYRVYGAGPQAGWLGVHSDQTPGFVRFSEGTEIELAPGSQTKIAEVTKRGAHVVLRSGRLRARVVHRSQTQWMVGAGPYAIDVTGTAFDVTWSDRGGELEVRLLEGSVIVRGPSLHEGIRVSAGQRLVAHSATGNAELSTLDALASARTAPAPAAAPTPPARRETPHVAPSWNDLLTDGNFRAVIAQAHSRGIESTLRRGALADLVALSDAARYSGDRGLARRGLLAQRRRFASKPEGRAAAFLLGRMADDQGSPDEAMHWYDLYLRESPRGVFAAEALGRKLVVLVRSGEDAGARALARQYLQRFDEGAHAGYAREVLSRP